MPASSSIDNILARAFEFELPKQTDTEWPYDWEATQCGTPHPTPRDNHATMWMTCNFGDSTFQDISDYFRMAKERLKATVERLPNNKLVVKDVSTNIELLTGVMHSGRPEANVGRYTIFQASTEAGCELIVKISSFSQWGYSTYIFHDKISRRIDSDKVLTVTSGLGPDRSDSQGLSTQFDLSIGNTVAARCHLSYRDLSSDPSIGPTVEMIAVRRDHRCKGLLPLLWFWVKTFIEDNFTLESLNKDAPVSHAQIKATKLTNMVIEVDERGMAITDKQFLYDWAGFSVRRQIDLTGTSYGVQRPVDEEGILYIPLLTREQVQERAEKRFIGDEAVEYKSWKRVKGARNCKACQRIKSELLRCTKCGQAYYCNVQCQKKDFKQHKCWCGKTRQEVHDELVKIGRRTENDDGSWSTVMV
jgi:hypothetical protein